MRCGSPTTSRFVMAEKIRPVEQMLELSDDEAVSAEHLDSQVQKAQEQLVQLKRQQEQIEKQKRELEELSRRQEELENGRAEMTDKLTRALVVLEREAYSVQNRLEQIRLARESFAQHLELVEAIDPRRGCRQPALPRAKRRCLMSHQTRTKRIMDVHFLSGSRSASRSLCR